MFPSCSPGWSQALPWGLSPTPAALSSPRFITLLSNHWACKWETCPPSSSLQLSELHSSCTHTHTRTRLLWSLCTIWYHLIRAMWRSLLPSLSPSNTPCTTLDNFSIHIDDTSRLLPPSFANFSSPLILSSLLLLTPLYSLSLPFITPFHNLYFE